MASKTKLNGLNGAHTAGIFSDMTVDGPEIGTLVLIVDRAKNLPNRKTIGKQDPYCAARLGKEAKKTDTDRRGGQTPRWDQELRYTVHDSPDYYQLKVSVFNDDKKTDLIGETWVDLKEVVVPGGGQNDLWHNLSCKGKYAGEIRIEITYYDTRPKQEKAEKIRPAATNGVDDGSRESLKGPRQPKAAVKRRPLPSDPITGAPASPITVPDHVQTPPNGYPPSPTAASDHTHTPPRGYQNVPGGIPDHIQTPQRGYQTPPSAIPEHVQPPQRGYQSPSYVPNQSPLQSMEYATAPANYSPSQGYDSSSNSHMNGYSQSPGNFTSTPPIQPPQENRYEPVPRNDYSQSNPTEHFRGDEDNTDFRDLYSSRQQQSPYELPQQGDFGSPPSPGGPPPPPPAHRTRTRSHVSPRPIETQGSYGFSQESRSPNQYVTSPQEVYQRPVPVHPQSNSYQAYSPDKAQEQSRRSAYGSYQQSPSRHQSYDPRYNGDYGAMQPTVEDAPPSPGGSYSVLRNGSRVSEQDERRYDQIPSPAPLNLSGRGSAASGRNSISNSTTPTHQYSNTSMGYPANDSRSSFSRSQTDMSVNSRPYNSMQSQDGTRPQMGGSPSYQQRRGRSEEQTGMANYALPPVPATLVPGMDPMIAQEIQERIYDEKRASYNQGAGNSARGRYQNSPQHQQNKPRLLSYHEDETAFVPAAAAYDDRQNRFSTATVPVVKPRAISPDPRAPMRKSVSPSPRPSDDTRRLSGVPFGPDSYNALNPSLVGSVSTPALSAAYDTKIIDPNAKIITHDGREIDPSDHIPESNYAPLLEQKGPKYASQLPDRNYRPPPTAPQLVSATGRRPLRQAGRPHSMATSSPIYMNNTPPYDPVTPTGRNRLQKKANRMSAHPAQNSSPLAPISPFQDNNYAQRSRPRSHSTDPQSYENFPPGYGGSPGYRGSAGPPPVPAKVPMGMNGHPPSQASGGDAWALLEEMKSIDLGHGRARRRGY
ncbi:related to calcineurin temperature suppressor Cts1 [Rhynchosporium secalis]|uniref:Related to calcineurin temperature suppressor Cts1 n=1 Tax=Rhynchosporium secalis TaxID=38038 RepID=A0A1E1M4T7_RHYSE|nr:related to calcineurin temperature suppressor Cts1 [Rhynchosporium secalis]